MESDKKTYIAFFDLDRTILSINSGAVLVREAYKRKLMNTSDFLKAIYLSLLYKFHLRDTDRIISDMGTWLKGIPLDKVIELSEFIVNKHLIDAIRPEIYKEIKTHKENNAEVVILSSAMEEICKPIMNHLGFHNYICTKMMVVNGLFTGIPEDKFCFENEKRVRLEVHCKKGNFKLNDAYYYGDSIADLPALEAIGHPVCVSPDKKLRKIAHVRAWEIKNW